MDLDKLAASRSDLFGKTIKQIKAATGLGERRARDLRRRLAEKHTPDDSAAADTIRRGHYEYDADACMYTFYWPRQSAPMAIARDHVRSMVRCYTKDGEDMSMQAVAVRHGLTRRQFERVKTILGLTKDHEPFTPEDLADIPEDDLFSDQMALKRHRLQRRVEVADERRTRDMAAKWQAFSEGRLEPIIEALQELGDLEIPEPPPMDTFPNVALHVHASDLHYGMYADGWASRKGVYNRDIAAERYLYGTLKCARALRKAYDSNFVILPVGGDFVHCDNAHGKTTSLRNTMDLDSTPERIVVGAVQLAVQMVEMLLEDDFTVFLCLVKGNHDAYTDVLIYQALRLAFRDTPNVHFHENQIHDYTVIPWGDYLLVEHHGHGIKSAKELGALGEGWARDQRKVFQGAYAFTGNLHHLRNEEDAGVMLFQQPSPAGTDRYHALNAYGHRARPAVAGFALSQSRGWLGTHYEPFE